MKNASQYLLIGNNCDHCLYITNAFTLLRLPLTTVSIDDLTSHPGHIKPSDFVLTCRAIEDQYANKIYGLINNADAQLISLRETCERHSELLNKPRYLTTEFSSTELCNALATQNHPAHDFDEATATHPALKSLLGTSKEIRTIRALIKQVAVTDSTVLILGQSGTGKDLVASCIHHLSNRKNNNLVPINCGAIPGELMESELFGHEKGSFTGASMRRLGRFEIANKGTLFLDEIGDMPLAMQVKLLRVLQERKIDRVGGNESIKVDVRIIAATNKNLTQEIQNGRFREDLFYRLNVFPIQVPSLRERQDDIPALIDFHLDRIYQRLNHRVIFTDDAKQVLCQYAWPGNIRELENFLERMVVIHQDNVLDVKDLDASYKQKTIAASTSVASGAFNIKEYIGNIERQAIELALQHSNGLIDAAAKYLSLAPQKLLEKMKKYHLLGSSK